MKNSLSSFLCISPALFLLFTFLIAPIFCVFILSFSDYNLGSESLNFVGLQNYKTLFSDEVFFISLKNTLLYVIFVLPTAIAGGLCIALLIESKTKARGLYRALFFLPVLATLIAMGLVWEYILHPELGILNHFLSFFGLNGKNWLSDEDSVLFSLSIIGIWQQLGYNMILFGAGLLSIPPFLYEAGRLDGMNKGQLFMKITLPLLSPVMFFVLIINAIKAFQIFDTVHTLTLGGPHHSSEVLLFTIYQEGFMFFRSSYAAAMSVVFLFFILILSLIKIYYFRRV